MITRSGRRVTSKARKLSYVIRKARERESYSRYLRIAPPILNNNQKTSQSYQESIFDKRKSMTARTGERVPSEA